MPPAFGAAIGNNAPGGGGTPQTTVAVTTTGSVPSGGQVIVGVGYFGSAANETVTLAGGGLSWTQDVFRVATAPALEYRAALFSAPAPAGLASSTALTATFSAACFSRTIAAIYLTSADTLDATGAGDGTSGSWSATFSTVAAETVIVAYTWVGSITDADVPLTNYVEAHDFNNGTDNLTAAMVYRAVTSAASYTPGGVVGSPGGNLNVVVAASYKSSVVVWPPADNPAAPALRLARSNLRLG